MYVHNITYSSYIPYVYNDSNIQYEHMYIHNTVGQLVMHTAPQSQRCMYVHCILYGTYIISLNLIDGMYERMYVFVQMYQNEHTHANCQQYSKSGPD